MKQILFLLFFSFFLNIQSQSQIVIYHKDGAKVKEPLQINKQSLLNLSSDKTILCYTFSINCQPCIVHLKDAIKLSKDYHTKLYVILYNKTGKDKTYAIEYLTQIDKDIAILTIDDNYGKSNKKSYKKFLKEITPNNFENISDLSKYIVIKNKKIVMITNYKDSEINDDWKDDMPMLKNKVIPLLK